MAVYVSKSVAEKFALFTYTLLGEARVGVWGKKAAQLAWMVDSSDNHLLSELFCA